MSWKFGQGGDVRGSLAIIKPALVGHVAKGIDMGVAVAMNLTGQIVESKTRLAQSGRAIEDSGHVVRNGVRVVRPGHLVDGHGHGDGAPRTDQRRRVAHTFGSDVVQRTAFIAGAPYSPIADALEQSVELLRKK
jgi:hypothetical protein